MSGANAKNIFFTNVPKKLECFVPSSPLYQNKVDFLNNESKNYKRIIKELYKEL